MCVPTCPVWFSSWKKPPLPVGKKKKLNNLLLTMQIINYTNYARYSLLLCIVNQERVKKLFFQKKLARTL